MAKLTIDNEADIPEALKSDYARGEDGKFHLQIEGDDRGTRIKEFRDRNIQLAKRSQTLEDWVKSQGVDPEELVRRGIDHEATTRKLRQVAVEKEALRLGVTAGVRKDALEMVASLAQKQFTVNDDGDLVSPDGTDPRTWVESLKASHGFLFEASNGGGAPGSATRGRPSGGAITKRSQLKDAAAKAAFIRQNGSDKYLELEP
jgi:hypothetical protein